MAIYNPMDEMIYGDNADPAYAVREIPIGQTATETDFAPATDPRPASDLDAYAFNEFNKLIDKAVLPQYQKITGKTLEENFGRDILDRQISIGQAFKEAGLPVDPNKESVSSAEFQDPVLRPLLLKYGYKPQSASEGLERVVETFFRAQREAREKRLRGETLTKMEEIDASVPMALLDALDFTGLIGLGVRGAFKASRAGLKYLLGESAKGTPKDVALKNFAELFPEDTKALQMSAVEEEKVRVGGGSGIPLGADDLGIKLAPDRNGTGGSGISDESSIVIPETNVKSKKVDEKVKKIIEENPDGPLGTNELRKNYNIEAKTYDKSIDRLSEANPNLNISKYKRDPEGSRKKLAEEATEQLNKEFRESIKGLETVDEIIANTKYTSKTSVYSRLQKLGDETLLRKYFYKQTSPDETANRINNFLKRNPNTNYTLPEVARSLGINYQTAFDQVAKGKITQKNLFTHQDKMAYENDIIISEMNRLLDDIANGKIEANKGPLFYQLRGYDIRMNSAEDIRIRPYLNFPTEGIETKLNILPESLSNVIGTKRGTKEKSFFDIKNFFDPKVDKGTASKLNAVKAKTRELYRTLTDPNKKVFVENMIDGFGFTPIKKFNEQGKLVPNPDYYEGINKGPLDNFYNTIQSISDPKDIEKIQDLLRQRRSLNKFTDKEFYNALANNKNFRDHFISEVNRVDPENLYNNDWEAMYRAYKQMFNGQLSHVAAVRELGENLGKKKFSLAPGLEGKGGESGLIRLNFDNHNISLQPRMENATRDAIKDLSKAIKNNSVDDMQEIIKRIMRNNDNLAKRGMLAYMRFTDKEMSDSAFQVLKQAFPEQVFKTTTKFGKTPAGIKTIIIGDPFDPSVNDLKKYFKEAMDGYVANPKKFKLSRANPKSKNQQDQMLVDGDADYIFEGKLLPSSFKQGGPVKMAIGGDPLTNLNQQQFSPDPAFEGQDFFQEAVDSGNLQAVNLFNLFKVFKKPKVMATPSNVKQVEQARDPMPQGVPGSQEIQPLPAGKPDFFFKSYLLDQLNLPNSPNASTPQGWREFLIKGKKVPEAEMLDTGILQYLEDTEKFYPNKKITKQEIEDLYDMSPLGNLEVRVKPVRGYPEGENVPQESFEFFADQGTQKHRGAGNAPIDNEAEQYFEVVVNVPTLPGQERAFVNSSHFSEPNVLGFTRVGTYKNSKNETVAVIQEMQTDMLTEVRKEQERLFAMMNALKRRRAQLVNQAQGVVNPEYYKNELRLFDQKYPPAKLEALETDNLIQPFPNIVAKDLIPERTANLNSIQEQINKLIMANVEQYNDPAYKTMVFDLAQQQNKIFEDLSSMNRSANYEENLRDFKVPSTTDRDELNRIASTDEYLPSDYQLKQVESFPPIPFNKQADYVDLLIKSTIKAAKGKGIDKVAIMPANVGANPRWGKTGDEARKKFENLYDKVGVQQLKNIAKKYGGTLQVEKIIDPSKSGKGLTFLNKNPDGQFQILKQTELRKDITSADADKYYDGEIKKIASGVTEPGEIVYSKEIAPGQMMDYYIVEGRGDATDVGYRMIPLKEGQNADDAMIKIVEYNPSEIDMFTISFDPSQLEEPMYLFKKKSGGSIDKDSLVSITDIYGEYGR